MKFLSDLKYLLLKINSSDPIHISFYIQTVLMHNIGISSECLSSEHGHSGELNQALNVNVRPKNPVNRLQTAAHSIISNIKSVSLYVSCLPFSICRCSC